MSAFWFTFVDFPVPNPLVNMSLQLLSPLQCNKSMDLSCTNCFTKWKCVLIWRSASCNHPGGMRALAIAFMLSVWICGFGPSCFASHSRHLLTQPGLLSVPSLLNSSAVGVGCSMLAASICRYMSSCAHEAAATYSASAVLLAVHLCVRLAQLRGASPMKIIHPVVLRCLSTSPFQSASLNACSRIPPPRAMCRRCVSRMLPMCATSANSACQCFMPKLLANLLHSLNAYEICGIVHRAI